MAAVQALVNSRDEVEDGQPYALVEAALKDPVLDRHIFDVGVEANIREEVPFLEDNYAFVVEA